MKCSNCGMDNIPEDAVHCPNCGASLLTPGNWDPNRQAPPQQQYQQPPKQGQQPQYQGPAPYQAPPQQYISPPPAKAPHVPIIRNIGLTEILLLFSGFFLIIVGFDNISVIKSTNFYGGQVFALGLVALLAGLVIVDMVITPAMFRRFGKQMDNIMDYTMLVLFAAFTIYGFVMIFASWTRPSGQLGFDGSELFVAGLAGLGAMSLKLGIML
jgi:hypothetical protein